MKRFTVFLLPAIVLLIISCSKDDDKSDYDYSFIDQDLQGLIGGDSWTVVAGNAEEKFEEGEFWIDLYPVQLDSPCDWAFDVDRIMFTVPAEVGLYELYLNLDSWEGYTITLYDHNDDQPINNVAAQGALEITRIDLIEGIVEGRMDVWADDENHVNGNFTIAYCE